MTREEPSPPPRTEHERLLREAVAGIRAQSVERGPAAASPETVGARFPDLDVLSLIGRGGMGAVYKAVQPKLGRTVALKVLPDELAAEPGFEERFLREGRALASLSHPHILTVYDFGALDGCYYLITEYVDGVNLRELMALGQLSPAEALRITPQICDALQFAHLHGIVHRDVKPENILVDTEGKVHIADFGLAKLVGVESSPALTGASQVLGTPHYMAPEQWRGSAAVDHRADIFSLGVVLYEMLTGQLPLGHYDPPSTHRGVPPGLDRVVQRTLAQQPENRYQNVRDVRSDVELQARSLGQRAPRHRRQQRNSRPSVLGVLLVVFAVLGAAGLAYAYLESVAVVEATKAALTAELTERAPETRRFTELARDRDEYQRQRQTIRRISASRVAWTRVLDELIDVVDGGSTDQRHVTWFKSIALSRSNGETGPTMTLPGWVQGSSLQHVANLYEDLEAARFFADVRSVSSPSGVLETNAKRQPAAAHYSNLWLAFKRHPDWREKTVEASANAGANAGADAGANANANTKAEEKQR